MMPVMNGLDFLARLRANARIAETPVIVASAFRELAARAPAQAILTKPLDLDSLLDHVARLSGQRPAGSSTTNVAP
jgi:CheY-like chemotaxis protein